VAPSLPPGPRFPRALQTLGWGFRPGPFMERCQRRYGDMFTLKIASEGTWVFVTHPDAVKQVFTGDPRLLHAGEGNKVLMPLLGQNSVLLLDEDPHMRQRKLMLPPFHGERMRAYRDVMTSVTEAELERWPQGDPFELWPRMQAITLEVIVRTVFGVSEGQRLAALRSALRELLEWGSDPRRLMLVGMLGPSRLKHIRSFTGARDRADELLFEEIRERRSAPDLAERDDVLSMLLQARYEDGSGMSDEELRDELMTLLVAGHETTATALSWAVERLVRHPEKLERLASGDEEYLDAVVKETLRLRPVLPLVLRRLTEPMEIGGRELPAGVAVAPCIYLMHRRPDVYPEPTRFRPERFLEEPAGTYTWIPFGGGVRRCLGATFAIFEMKVVLETIAARLRLTPADPRSERISRRLITLIPERGAQVVASRPG
jgi:cytochrome P450